MSTAPQAFRRRLEDKKAKVRPSVSFVLESFDDDTNEVTRTDTFDATKPTDEVMFMLAALIGDDDISSTAEAAAIMDIFKRALPEEQYKVLRHRLLDENDDVDIEMLTDVLTWLMGEWSGFPTEPSSASSPSEPSTGTRSTGRVRGQGSTRTT